MQTSVLRSGGLLRRSIRLLTNAKTLASDAAVHPTINTPYYPEFDRTSEVYLTLQKQIAADKQRLLDAFPAYLQIASVEDESYQEFNEHLKELLEYNATTGSQMCGLLTYASGTMLRGDKPKELTEEEMRDICHLSWCSQLFATYIVVYDDLLDGGKVRRGQTSWHKREGVGVNAMNDAFVMYFTTCKALKTHFGHRPFYHTLLQNYTDNGFWTHVGQVFDRNTANKKGARLNQDFILNQNYPRISHLKTGIQMESFVLAGMQYNEIKDPIAYEQMISFISKYGQLIQYQNDAVDCYGNPDDAPRIYTSKPGKDIRDGEITWFLTKALQIGNKQQTKAILDNYGKDDDRCIQEVRNVYADLRLDEHYKQYVENTLEGIYKEIHSSDWRLPANFFHYLLGIQFRYDVVIPHMRHLFVPNRGSISK